jgi:pimeloyl-ACP methyl ester carboxylesterase
VLLVEGDKSPLYVRSIMDELQRCIAGNEIATLANTTHGLEYENPAEFNRAVLKFLDKH